MSPLAANVNGRRARAALPDRKLDQRDVRVFAYALEQGSLAVRRDIEPTERLARPQPGQLSPHTGRQVEQPEVLPSKPAKLHHQPFPLCPWQESIAVPQPIDEQGRRCEWKLKLPPA